MTTNDEGELRVHKARLTILFIVALVLGVAVTGSYFLVFDGALPDDHAVWGMFGDFVGGTLNPIFALFALAALLYTISLQVHELQAVRKELAQTSETANRQSFEHTFFQMIRLHHDIVARIDVTPDHLSAHDSPTDFKGPTAFKTFCKELDEHLNYYHGEPLEDRREYIQLAWSEFFEARYPSIIHYFRHLFALLLFVKEHAPNVSVRPRPY